MYVWIVFNHVSFSLFIASPPFLPLRFLLIIFLHVCPRDTRLLSPTRKYQLCRWIWWAVYLNYSWSLPQYAQCTPSQHSEAGIASISRTPLKWLSSQLSQVFAMHSPDTQGTGSWDTGCLSGGSREDRGEAGLKGRSSRLISETVKGRWDAVNASL